MLILTGFRGHCQGADFYLEQKNLQIGAYCSTCSKWIQWVSKKHIKVLESVGYTIHKPGEVVTKTPPVFEHSACAEDDEVPWDLDCDFCELQDYTGVVTAPSNVVQYSKGFTYVTDTGSGQVVLKLKTTHCPYCGKKLK